MEWVLGLVLSLVYLHTLVDAALRPRSVWLEIGRSKLAWMGLLLALPFLAAVLYWLSVRPALREAGATSAQSQTAEPGQRTGE